MWPEHPLSPVKFPRMTMPRSTLWQRCSQAPPGGCLGPSCGVELRASPRPWLSLLPHPWPSQSPQPERRGKYSLPWEAPSPEVASVSVTETEGGELTRQWKGRCQEGEKPRRRGPGEADPARPGAHTMYFTYDVSLKVLSTGLGRGRGASMTLMSNFTQTRSIFKDSEDF